MEAWCPIYRYSQVRPDALALVAEQRRWTYRELDRAVAATSAALESADVGVGTRVALRIRREGAYVVLLWALWRTGAVAVPLSTRLPAQKAIRMAGRAGATLLLTREPEVQRRAGDSLETRVPDAFVVEEGRRGGGSGPQSIDRHATIVFTSGSTRRPTPVLHSWGNHLYSAKGSNANIPLHADDRWLLSLPLYHVGGLAILVRCALAGASVAVSAPDASVHSGLEATASTHVSLVATQFKRLLDASEGTPPPYLRVVLLGGGPLPDPLLRRGYERGWPLHTSYGSTEMASQITATAPGASLEDLRTAGRVLPHRRLRTDADDQILVSGPTLCAGIATEGGLRDPRVDGWYPTGDLGWIDASGRLHVEGRVDRQFVSGGENIQPREIEGVLEAFEEVERAVVVSVPDEEYGRRPVGFVQTDTGRVPTGWEGALDDRLPPFKIPEDLHVLPRAAVDEGLKVDHGLLRKIARRGGEQKIGEESAPE